jgi:hypothetical protein
MVASNKMKRSTMKKILFISLFFVFIFSLAYLTGMTKETRFVQYGVVTRAEFDDACLLKNPDHPENDFGTPFYEGPDCETTEWIYGQVDCLRIDKDFRSENCYEVQKFSLIKTGTFVLVFLIPLLYFRFKNTL